MEALWALTNIAAGAAEHTHVLIKHGAVPTLVSLLSSSNEEVLEQAMWVLGNLAGEGSTARDIVLGSNALRPVVLCLQRAGCGLSMLRIGSWTLSNMCEGQARPVVDLHLVLSVLSRLLRSGSFMSLHPFQSSRVQLFICPARPFATLLAPLCT